MRVADLTVITAPSAPSSPAAQARAPAVNVPSQHPRSRRGSRRLAEAPLWHASASDPESRPRSRGATRQSLDSARQDSDLVHKQKLGLIDRRQGYFLSLNS